MLCGHNWAEKKYFDPYELATKLVDLIAKILYFTDRAINWVYDSLVAGITCVFSSLAHKLQAGYYVIYVIWSLVGAVLVMSFVLK